jgi:hypothetical protein
MPCSAFGEARVACVDQKIALMHSDTAVQCRKPIEADHLRGVCGEEHAKDCSSQDCQSGH